MGNSRALVLVAACAFVLMPVAGASGAYVYDWTRASGIPENGTITDQATTDFNFVVPDIGTVLEVELRFSVLHTYAPDLGAVLIAPDATTVALFTQLGLSGENFQDTLLDDHAAVRLGALYTDYPYAGSYKLAGAANLSDFIGKNAQGTWILRITDYAEGDEGRLIANGETVDWGSGEVEALGTQLFIVPEPATMTVLLAGTGCLLSARKRRRAKA